MQSCNGIRRVRRYGFHVLGMVCSAAVLHAQQPSATLATDRAPLAPFVTPDTVRNITGYLVHGPESTPATCLAAIQLARMELDRQPYQDTLAPAIRTASDTLPADVRALGARCGTAFTTQTVAARDLESYLALALQLGDSSQAAAAAARWVAAPQQQPADRGETPIATQCKRLTAAVDMYLAQDLQGNSFKTQTTLPFTATLSSVQPLVQQLDALGPLARKDALAARAQIILAQLDHATRLGQWMPEHTIQMIRDFLPLSDAAAHADRPYVTILEMPEYLIRARGYLDPVGVSAFYDSLRTASPTIAYIDTSNSGFWGKLLRIRDLSPFDFVGKVVPPVSGTYWYHAPGLAEANNTWPHPGRVSLLFAVRNELSLENSAMIRRLSAQYGPKGLSITIVTKTKGYWLKSGSNTGPVPPAEEAANDSAFYLGYRHLPVTLVVVPATFTRDNEQRLHQAAPAQIEIAYPGIFQTVSNGKIVLADREGHFIVNDVINDEARLAAYISQAVGP